MNISFLLKNSHSFVIHSLNKTKVVLFNSFLNWRSYKIVWYWAGIFIFLSDFCDKYQLAKVIIVLSRNLPNLNAFQKIGIDLIFSLRLNPVALNATIVKFPTTDTCPLPKTSGAELPNHRTVKNRFSSPIFDFCPRVGILFPPIQFAQGYAHTPPTARAHVQNVSTECTPVRTIRLLRDLTTLHRMQPTWNKANNYSYPWNIVRFSFSGFRFVIFKTKLNIKIIRTEGTGQLCQIILNINFLRKPCHPYRERRKFMVRQAEEAKRVSN